MTPGSESELSEAIHATKSPLCIRGGGTRSIGLCGAKDNLSTASLTGVSLYEPGALTLIAKAGTPLADIKTLLADEGQQLAFEPMDHRGLFASTGTPTIGGVVAANVSGPRRIQVGACRDFLLGVRFVDGAGRVLKNGGRVMKNVTGYDLVKLMAGSFGTLGVLSEVSLKVLPIPETEATLLIEGLKDAEAIKAHATALGSPFDVTGAAHAPIIKGSARVAMFRIEGFEKSVAYRAEKLRDVLAGFGEITIESDAAKSAALWKAVRDVLPFQESGGDVWRIGVKPSDGPLVGQALCEAMDADIFYDWGGGLVWARVSEGVDARAALRHVTSHARLERASEDVKKHLGVFEPQNPVLEKISQGLRDRFDPRGLLNPGLMG